MLLNSVGRKEATEVIIISVDRDELDGVRDTCTAVAIEKKKKKKLDIYIYIQEHRDALH